MPIIQGHKKLSTAERLKRNEPIEVWESADGSWRWEVYKKNQKNDDKPYASWFCKVYSPFTRPGYDMGDTYVADIKSNARRVK